MTDTCGFLSPEWSVSLCPSAIPLTAYGPMAAAAAAAVVRGAQNQLYYGCCMIFYFQILRFVKLFPLVKYFLSVWDICLLSVARRFHPVTRRVPGRQQPWANGRPLCSSQSGFSQQLHQCGKPRPQHGVRTWTWGRYSQTYRHIHKHL